MNWLRTIAEEAVSLFIDDGRLALAVVLWPALLWLAITFGRVPSLFAGPVLFIGFLCVLAESALRRARK